MSFSLEGGESAIPQEKSRAARTPVRISSTVAFIGQNP
jgi:hypothetical protein